LRRLLALVSAEIGPRSRDPLVWGGYRADVRAAIERHVRLRSPFVADTLDTLRRTLDRDAVVTNDNCLFCFWAGRYLPMYEPRTWHFPMQFCTLGWALPAAIGAKIARRERQVVALAGDGGFMFTCQELVTAAALGLNLPVIVFNDGAYGSVRENQTKRYGGRHSGISLATPDFPRLAEACHARGVRLTGPGELAGALAEAFAADRPTLIEMPVTLEFP
jgi:acetolactate synthase-1/2/3 large subunit